MIQPIEILIRYEYDEHTMELVATASTRLGRRRPTVIGHYFFQEVPADQIVATIGALTSGLTDLTNPRVRQWFALQVRQRIKGAF